MIQNPKHKIFKMYKKYVDIGVIPTTAKTNRNKLSTV
jgi:hypothetical protein